MKEITELRKIEEAGKALSSISRVVILRILIEHPDKKLPLVELHKKLNEFFKKEYKKSISFTTVQDHCLLLVRAGFVQMDKELNKTIVKLKKIPKIYIEEIK